jgi:RNA polymerase sigma factor (sigma-70 family)
MQIRKNRVSREVGVEDPAEAVEPSDSVPNPQEICARTEQKAALRDAIAKLRPTLRNVVDLYDLQECFRHETAEALGISVAAAKGRLFHARAALRRTVGLTSVLGARHHSRKKILSCEEVAPLHSFSSPRFSACASE